MSKIEIDSISFRNLFSYGNRWQTFSLKTGISFITGHNAHNDRRNFTGKSNLLKMFPYSLFGKVEGKNKQRIINWKNKKNAEIYVNFHKGETKYSIHRGIKPDILEVYEDDKLIPIPSHKKDFQTQIEQDILEMNYDSFMNIVYADTNNTSSIFTLSKPSKRLFLDQMFDLSYYGKLKDKTLKTINQVEKEIQQLESDIQKNEDRKKDLSSQIVDFRSDLDNVTDSSDKLQKYENSIQKNKDKYTETKETIKNLEKQYEENRKNNEKYNQIISKILQKIREIEKYKTNRKIEDIDVDSIDKSIEDLMNQISDLEIQIVDYSKYADDYFEQVKSDCVKYKTELSALDKKYKELDKKINSKSDIVECPTCFQKVDHKLIKQHFEKEKVSLDNEYKKIKGQLDIRKVEKETIEEENKKKVNNELLETEIEDKENLIKQYTEKRKQWEETERAKQRIEKYKRVIEKLKSIEKSYSNLLVDLDSIVNEIDDHKNFIDEYEKLLEEREKLRDSIEREKQERERIKTYIDKNNEKIEELERENQSLDKKLKTAKKKTDYLKCIKDLCSDEEARQYTISNKIPLLNKYVNDYLSKTGVRYYVKLDNWLDVTINGPGIKGCTYQDLSGAERISLDRSLQFAFNDINRLQSSSFMDLLILDEILDSSVDSEGLKNILDIIKVKQYNDNSKVLIVSHRENIDNVENLIDNFYCVEFDGKYSQLKEGV